MKLIVNKDRSVIPIGTWGTVNENDYEILDFEFPEELEGYNKRIVYYLDDTNPWDAIVDNKAYITNAITSKENVKAYIWCTKENSERPADTDFRSQEFEMHFYENENADGIVPTPVQVDGFNTMLTAMNAKIDEADALEQTIETAEAQRQEAEATRVSNESTRESNESTRQTNEQTRQSQEAERERRTNEAIGNIEDKTAEYNANAEAKTTAFNNNATQKTNDFNNNYTQKVNDFNTDASSKETAFNSNASSKTSDFNSNAETKTNAFNTNATNKTNDFDNNATEKTSEYNTNAESKTSAFNDNATQKTTNFDNNASEKTDEFNTNAQNKIDEYDEHIVEYQAQIDELQEEVEELSENMPWTETEQGTYLDITDAAKYSRNKLELFGNTEQIQYTGKNLLDTSANNTTLFAYFDGQTGEVINDTTKSNCIFNEYIEVKPDTSYTISSKEVTNYTIYGVAEYNESKEFIQALSTGNTHPLAYTFTTTENTKYIRARYKWTANTEITNDIIEDKRIQIEEGSGATDYEPYTGGIPSPNPDYPQDIHIVTGNNSIECNSKNLYNATTQYTSRGIRVECDTQFIYLDGKATSTGSINFPTIPLKKGTYKIMFKLVSGSITSTSDSALFYVYGTGSTSVIRLSDNQKKNSRTFVLNTNGNMYIHLWARTTETFTNAKIAYQVVKGSTDDYNFVPYRFVTYPLELCIGKNRFNISESKLGKSMDTSGSVTDSIYTNLSNYISVKANKTYTLSFKYETLMHTNDRAICYYDKNKVFISGNNYVVANKLFTFTPAQDGYVRFGYDINCYDIQVEEGDTATEYVPYNSLELCKIGDYQDYLYKDNGNWYKKNIFKKTILDGTEFWSYQSINSVGLVNVRTNVIQSSLTGFKFIGAADKLRLDTSGISSAQREGFNNSATEYFYIRLWKDRIGVVDEDTSTDIVNKVKTWLASNNLIVLSVLDESTTTQITDETLISQLEAIYNHLALVKGTNHITVTASDLAPYMELSYMQDLPSKLDNLDSRLALLE